MAAMKQIVELEQQLLKSTYLMLNQDLSIIEVYQDHIGLFPSTNIDLQNKQIKNVINKEFIGLIAKLEVGRSKKTPSLFEVLTGHNNEFEVELIPVGKFIMVFIKDRVTKTNFMLNNLNEKNIALESNYHELLESFEDANQANREKKDLLLLLGHEIRTPLNSINGYLQILMSNSEQSLTKEQQNRLLKIKKASKQIEIIMNDALDYVRLKQDKLKVNYEKIDVKELIEDCIQSQSIEASEKNISILHQIGDSNISIRSDSNKLTQVLMNVLSNAVKYTNDNGHIHINSFNNDQRLLIEIIDSGVGIQAKELAFIFSPYYRSSATDSMSTGLGIGLSLVKKLLAELGGSIHVASEVGIGSSFIIELPMGKINNM